MTAKSHHKQPSQLEQTRARIDAETERERVVEEFRRSLVEVDTRTYPRKRARGAEYWAAKNGGDR